MPSKSPDLYLIALLEAWGAFPHPVAEALVDWYSVPVPVNYETAEEFVSERMAELIASGRLDEEGMPVDNAEPPDVDVEGGEDEFDELGTIGHPPLWWLEAYRVWYDR